MAGFADIGDFEWPWTAYWLIFCVISSQVVAFRANYVMLTETLPEDSRFWHYLIHDCRRALHSEISPKTDPPSSFHCSTCAPISSHLSNTWALTVYIVYLKVYSSLHMCRSLRQLWLTRSHLVWVHRNHDLSLWMKTMKIQTEMKWRWLMRSWRRHGNIRWQNCHLLRPDSHPYRSLCSLKRLLTK